MTALNIVDTKTMIAILNRLGFKFIRQRGSHAYYAHPDGRSTVIPKHQGEDLGRGLIRQILRDIDISVEEYERLRRKSRK